MAELRLLALACCVLTVACGGPVAAPSPPSGALIAHGGGSGGPGDACFACHGLDGLGRGRTPRLAGLDAGYIAKQLADYALETRRPDDTMTPIARRMSYRDHREVARYYASMTGPAPSAPPTGLALYHEGDRDRGVRRCVNCHGADGAGEGAANPQIAGQPAAYTAEQLRRWKRGERRNDAQDAMGSAVRGMTDPEIEAIAGYIEQMQ